MMKSKTSSQKWLVLLSVGFGSFMSSYVGSVVSDSQPKVTTFFKKKYCHHGMVCDDLPIIDQFAASGILATAKSIGMVFGVGIPGAIYTTIVDQGVLIDSSANIFRAIQLSYLLSPGIALVGAFMSFQCSQSRNSLQALMMKITSQTTRKVRKRKWIRG